MRYKWWVIVAVGLLGVGLASGLATPAGIAGLLAGNIAALKELGANLVPFKVSTALFIFRNNVIALLFSFVLSPILCLVPILALTVNGWLISFVGVMVVQEKSLGVLLSGLLPHGVFELPAVIMGEAAALSFGAMTLILLLRRDSRDMLLSFVTQDGAHLLLSIALLFLVGPFYAVIILALMKEQTKALLIPNLKQNLKYLVIACALLLPAAVLETYVTPRLLGLG